MTQPTASVIERLRAEANRKVVEFRHLGDRPLPEIDAFQKTLLEQQAATLLEEAVKVLQIAIGEVYEAGDGRAIRLDSQWLEEATACAARIQGTRT